MERIDHWPEKGEIEFTFDGKAHAAFKRNRIGFSVLHGPAAAGQPWVLETTDGKTTEGAFPKFISAHQPAKDLRAIIHEVADGIRARVEFEGEVFEMEDQRNWTDASFKTYCIPLERPYPVQLAAGDTVSQKVRVSLEGGFAEDPAHFKAAHEKLQPSWLHECELNPKQPQASVSLKNARGASLAASLGRQRRRS